MRRGASFCRLQAEDTNGEAFRAGHFLRLTETGNRARKASGHPGYSHIGMVTIFGVIRMGVDTTPDIFGAGTETIPDMASVNTKEQ